MIFTLNNGLQVCVWFTHIGPKTKAGRFPANPRASHQTTCSICQVGDAASKRNTWPIIAEGNSFCSRLDNYDKFMGNERAVARAVKVANWTKETRKIFWREYFRTTGRRGLESLRAIERQFEATKP